VRWFFCLTLIPLHQTGGAKAVLSVPQDFLKEALRSMQDNRNPLSETLWRYKVSLPLALANG